MRMIKFLGSVVVFLLLLSVAVSLAQTVPPNAIPFISQVSPPSLPVTTTAPGNGNFTLTVLGANFQANSVVNLSFPGGSPVHPSTSTVNPTGSQITATFTNALLPTPATLVVTVTNPAGTPPSTSNAFYLPETPAESSVALNQDTTSSLPGTPKGMVAGDFRGNGLLDFAVVSQGANTVSVEWSNAGGPFIAGGTYPTGNWPSGIVAADFLGSGQLGLAIVNSLDNTITILLPNGDGTFRPGTLISVPGSFPTQLVAGDFNGDGKIDLAVLNTCGAGPTASCFPSPSHPYPGSVTILLGNGDGTFTISPVQLATGNNPGAIAAADLNGDGFIDLVVANFPDNNLTVLMGNGDGTFTPTRASPLTGHGPQGIAIGDFNGDGNLDIAVTNSTDSNLSILLNQNCGLVALQECTFSPTSIPPATGSYPVAVATGDLNADGFLDLVVTNASGSSVSILLGDGKGGFNPVVPQSGPAFTTALSPEGVVLGDFNQDGRLDIVTSNTSGSFSYLRQVAVAQVVLTTDTPNTIYWQVPALTATVNPPPGTDLPTGAMTFFDGSAAIGTVPLSGSQALLEYAGLSAGTHQVTAVYSGDANFVSVTSNAVAETVSQAQTTTTLTSNVSTVAYGLPFTLTASIQTQAGGVTTGTVTFFDTSTSTDLGDITPVNNVAQLTLSKLPAGTHVILATYQADPNFSSSSSPSFTETVVQASSTTSLSSYPNPSTFNQQITFSATVQSSSSGTATGNVSFYDGATLVGTAILSNNLALFQTTSFAGGSHSITARYAGDANTSGSTSSVYNQTVNPAPTTVTLISRLNPAFYGQTVNFDTTVRSAISQISEGQLSYYDGATLLYTIDIAKVAPGYITSYLTGGTHSITAQYSGTSNYAASSSTITQTVNPSSTGTTVATLPNPSSVGQSVSVAVGVNPAYYYGSSGGTVTLYDNGTPVGTAILPQAGSVNFTFTAQNAGTHTLTASYGGDSNLLASTSAAYTQTVNPAATTLTVSLSSNATNYGQPVTITSAVHGAFGGSPTGTITLLDGSTTLGTVPMSNGSAQYTFSALPPASHLITAKYSGDSNFLAGTSGQQTLTVSQATTTTTTSVDTNPSTYGQTVNLSAAVQLGSGSGATGSIAFLDGSTTLGTATISNNAVQLAVSSLAGGTHSITAKYSGDANFAASTSAVLTETVNPAATSTAIASAANPAIVGQNVTFTATVQSPSGTTPSGTITFLDGTTALGTAPLASNSAQLTVSTLTVGAHSITAVYGGNSNLASSTSAMLAETINQAPTTTTFTSSPNPANFGQAVRFVATVQPPYGGAVTGTVTFYDATTALGTATVVNSGGQSNQATLIEAGFLGGTHTITATYSGDPNYAASTSAATVVTVNPASSTVSVASSQNPTTFGKAVVFTATVQPSISGDLASGTVTFFDGATSLGTAALSSDAAQLSVSNLSAGSHSITAKYNGDSNFSGSTSAVLTQTINPGASTTAVASSLNPSVFGQSVTFTATVQPPAGTTATGTITFLDGTATLGTATLSSNSAQLAVSLSTGSHSITASYGGNVNLSGSVSSALTQTVNQAATTTAASSSLNPSTYGQPVTFTATVQPATGGSATGTVAFFDGSVQIGSASVASNVAQFTTAGTALTAGSHTITARYSGDTNYSASTSAVLTQTVNAVSSSSPTIDVQVFADQPSAKSTVKTVAFSTSAANELLLAFISSDASGSGSNSKVNSISGGGLTWTLVLRTNTQRGTAEIWRAFTAATLSNVTVTATLSQNVSSSLTVMSFSGVDTSGSNGSGAIGATQSANASSGAPTAQLVTTRNESLVIGVGDDYDNAISRTLGSGQTLVHQYLSPVGDTYWVQMRNAPTPLSGTTVVINDTAPTGDRYNLAVCEVLAAP